MVGHNICEMTTDKQREAIKQFLSSLLNTLDTCSIGTGKKPSKTTKRAPSQYNKFIQKCASSPEKGGQGKSMKECAREWGELKKRGIPKNGYLV